MKASFLYEVRASVHLSTRDVLMLKRLSKAHYDGVCQLASKPGGFIYTMLYGLKWKLDTTLTSMQIDTICKILEGAEFLKSHIAIKRAERLTRFFHNLLKSMMVERDEVNRLQSENGPFSTEQLNELKINVINQEQPCPKA